MPASGTLYIVATPIGNLGDISARALSTLTEVELVAAEDTRRCRKLLDHYGIHTRVLSYHDHSKPARLESLIERLQLGSSIALVSDAGTPLVSDPGFGFVSAARSAGIEVVAVPGPCAAIAALCIAGLPTDRFVFEGFLPSREGARRAHLASLRRETRTMVFYEAPHRIVGMLADCAAVFGSERSAAVARELTKRYETVLDGDLDSLLQRVAADPDQQRGELVVLVAGSPRIEEAEALEEGLRVLSILTGRLSHRDAVAMAARISGCARNKLYKVALQEH